MADDFGGFDLGLGSDPFGGGSEGLPKFDFNADSIKSMSSPVDWSQAGSPQPGAPEGGLKGFAGRLFGGGGDRGSTGQPGGSGGIMEGVGSGLQGIAKGILPAAQLGLAGLGVKSQLDAAGNARRASGAMQQGQQITRESAQPLQQFGAKQLNQAGAGQIDPAIQQEIDNLVQAQIVQARQWMASNNISDSTMMQSIERDIMNKAEAMKAQVIGMDKNTAIAALQAAMQGGGQMTQAASQEQNELDNLIAASNRALAALTGSVG